MTKRSSNQTPSRQVAEEVKENKAWRVKRKPVSAEYQAPAVRGTAHALFTARPNTDAIAQQFGNGRIEIVDAVVYELHRRTEVLESILGLPPGGTVPFRSVRSVVLQMKGRAA